MLNLLHIENIAVIESADISFDSGFNVLTGETGAGKSIVIDAISAILGERAYRDMIRTGTAKASVRAVFTQVPQLAWFQDNGVEYDEETVIQRDIFLDGKNVCRVNGALVSVAILRKLGIQLINIHGQHDSASLFDEANHLIFLDDFSSNQALRLTYGEKYETVASLRREIQRMTMDEGEKLRRMETLKYQIAEIEKAELEAGEDEALEERRKLLQNAEKLSKGMDEAVEALCGGEESEGAAELLSQAEHALARLSRFSDNFSSLHDRVADLMYQLRDAAEEVKDARDDLSYSADELEQIEARLDVIHRLRRKYGVTCVDILSYLEQARKELDNIEFADDHLERLKSKLKKAEDEAWDAAKKLRQKNETLQIVFITGYSDYIAEGYEVSALHYLMKPVKKEKLFSVLNRAAEKLRRDENMLHLEAGGQLVRIPIYTIRYADVQGNYVTVHAFQDFTVKMTLSELEKELDDRFYRVGRSAIVNLTKIRRVTKTEILLQDGTTVPLPRGAYDGVNRAIINMG